MSKPVAIYRAAAKSILTRAQETDINATVKDLELWKATLEHWDFHGWDLQNVYALLEMYFRGGPTACRKCHNPSGASNSRYPKTVNEMTLDELDEFFRRKKPWK